VLAIGAANVGIDMRIAAPRNVWRDEAFVARINVAGKITCGRLTMTESVNDAVKGADVIYTDVWHSMGVRSILDNTQAFIGRLSVDGTLLEANAPKQPTVTATGRP
jgi:ornithine carbamoyltransferase